MSCPSMWVWASARTPRRVAMVLLLLASRVRTHLPDEGDGSAVGLGVSIIAVGPGDCLLELSQGATEAPGHDLFEAVLALVGEGGVPGADRPGVEEDRKSGVEG